MEKLIKKVQEQLDNNWAVDAEDIQALIDIVLESQKQESNEENRNNY